MTVSAHTKPAVAFSRALNYGSSRRQPHTLRADPPRLLALGWGSRLAARAPIDVALGVLVRPESRLLDGGAAAATRQPGPSVYPVGLPRSKVSRHGTGRAQLVRVQHPVR